MYYNGQPIEKWLVELARREATKRARIRAYKVLQQELKYAKSGKPNGEALRNSDNITVDRDNPDYIAELERRIARLRRVVPPSMDERRAQTRERVRRYRERKRQNERKMI